MAGEKKVYTLVATVRLYAGAIGEVFKTKKTSKVSMEKVDIEYPVSESDTENEKMYGFSKKIAWAMAVKQALYGDSKTVVSKTLDTVKEGLRIESWFTSPRTRQAGPDKVSAAKAAGIAEGKAMAEDNLAREYGYKDAADMRAALLAKKAAKK